MSRDLVVALSGGIGGAKLALGLSRIVEPDNLIVVANVGDDFEHLGLHISPDSDTLMYTLAGLDNTKLGWGRRDETWSFMETLAGARRRGLVPPRRSRPCGSCRAHAPAQGGRDLSPPSPPISAAASASARACCRRPTIGCAPGCERMRDGSTSRIISCAFNAARRCASSPSTARRMRALILSFWRPCATNDCARWSSARPTPSSASSRSWPSRACARLLPVASRPSSPFPRSSAAARSRVRQPR